MNGANFVSENLDGTKPNEVDGSADARAVPPGAQVLLYCN